MARKEIPSDTEVVLALRALGGHSTAVDLCDRLVAAGNDRGDAQLAIQRATDRRHLVINKDWTLSLVAHPVAA